MKTSYHLQISTFTLTFSCLILSGLLSISHAQETTPLLPQPPAYESLPAGTATPLGTALKDAEMISATIDGKFTAAVIKKGSREALIINGTTTLVYDEIFRHPRIKRTGAVHAYPAITADGKTVIYTARRGEDHFVIANGVESPPYSEISDVIIPPAGGSYAAIVIQGQQNEITKLYGLGPQEKENNGGISKLYFSDDGKNYFYYAYPPETNRFTSSSDRRWDVILNGRVINTTLSPPGQAGSDSFQSAVFSKDGSSVAYIIKEKSPPPNSKMMERVVLHKISDIGSSKPFDVPLEYIFKMRIDQDGSHVAYTGSKQVLKEGSRKFIGVRCLIINNEPFPLDEAGAFWLSANGKLATIIPKAKGQCLWMDGKTSLEYNKIRFLQFSPDEKTAAFIGITEDGTEYLVVNDTESDGYSKIQDFQFHADGSSYSFLGYSRSGLNSYEFVTVGQKVSAIPADSIVRSANGEQVLVIQNPGVPNSNSNQPQTVLWNGKNYSVPGKVKSETVVFSPDGNRVAFTFSSNNGLSGSLWLDGEVQPYLQDQRFVQGLSFTQDSKHFIYTATVYIKNHPKRGGASGYNLHVRVIDGKPSPPLFLSYPIINQQMHRDATTFPTIYHNDGTFEYYAYHDDVLQQIRLSPAVLEAMPTIEQLDAQEKKAKVEFERMEQAKKEQAKTDAEKTLENKRAKSPYQVIHHFEKITEGERIDHAMKPMLIYGNDGYIYGITAGGRHNFGILFRTRTTGGAYEVLHDFNGFPDDLQYPTRIYQAANGTIYGTTGLREDRGEGGIFKYSPSSREYKVLYHEFHPLNIYTGMPLGAHLSQDGYLYGTLVSGLNTRLFRFHTESVKMEILSLGGRRFSGASFANIPLHAKFEQHLKTGDKIPGKVIYAHDRFFMVEHSGGKSALGCISSMDLDGSNVRQIQHFSPSDGRYPFQQLAAGNDGYIYGVTRQGGPEDGGIIYRLKADGTSGDVIDFFPKNSNNHLMPTGAVAIGKDGMIYVVTGNPATGLPEKADFIIGINLMQKKVAPVHAFAADVVGVNQHKQFPSGITPSEVLICGNDGALYGITYRGGKYNGGVLYRISVP